MKIFIVLVLGTSLFGQAKEVNSSAMWGVYSGYQSMQISGIEDDASDEELSSFSSDRLGSYYIGVWKSTDWKIGSLPVAALVAIFVQGYPLKSGMSGANWIGLNPRMPTCPYLS